MVFVEIGACDMRLVCLMLEMTGLNRFVGASFGTQQKINRDVEEAMVAYRCKETERLAQTMTSTRRRGTRFPCCEAKSGRAGGQCLASIYNPASHIKALL